MTRPANPEGSQTVGDIVDRLEAAAQGDCLTLGEAIKAFGRRSFLPLLLIPSLLVVSPLSGIPLFSSLCGITIALISAQMLWPGQKTLWMPKVLLRQSIRSERIRAALGRLHRMARWLDSRAQPRLRHLVTSPGRRVIECACLISGAAMPFLEFMPFSSSMLGAAVTLMGVGLMARDGLIAAFGLAVTCLAAAILIGLFLAVF